MAAGLVSELDAFSLKDPIYGMIYIHRRFEEDIINHYAMQRLRRIKQLQLTYLVYPGANHTRFEHSLGVMHLSGLFARHVISMLLRNKDRYRDRRVYADVCSVLCGDEEAEVAVRAARVAGLLHDVGHAALGHFYDGIIAPMLFREKGSSIGELYRVLGFRIDLHEYVGYLIYKYFFREKLRSTASRVYGGDMADLFIGLVDAILKPINMVSDRVSDEVVEAGLLLRMVVRDWLYPADILDYLMRDSYYTGVESFGAIDYMRLIEKTVPVPVGDERMALAVERRGLPNVIRLMRARLQMYENVYYHPVVYAFNTELEKILRDKNVLDTVFPADPTLLLTRSPSNEKKYLGQHMMLTDDTVVSGIMKLCRPDPVNARCRNSELSEEARRAIEKLFLYRKPSLKLVYLETLHYKPRYIEEAGVSGGDAAEAASLIEKYLKKHVPGINERDVRVLVHRISFLPESFGLIQGYRIYVATRIGDRHRIDFYDISVFSEQNKLYSEALVRIYIERAGSRQQQLLLEKLLETTISMFHEIKSCSSTRGLCSPGSEAWLVNSILEKYASVITRRQATL